MIKCVSKQQRTENVKYPYSPFDKLHETQKNQVRTIKQVRKKKKDQWIFAHEENFELKSSISQLPLEVETERRPEERDTPGTSS